MAHRDKLRIVLITAVLAGLLAAGAPAATERSDAERLVQAARILVRMPTRYDGRYRYIAYPWGDPGRGVGVCTDLVIRSYRMIGVNLQVLVHEDMTKNWVLYPASRLYDQRSPDTNIDHRRVPNLMTFFFRYGQSLTLSTKPEDVDQWQPGDLVVFDLVENGIPSHVGIISDRMAESGLPLVFHHFPPSPTEEDCLTTWKIVGHYRYFPEDKISFEGMTGKPIPVSGKD